MPKKVGTTQWRKQRRKEYKEAAAGGIVEVTYRGVEGDKEHPVAAESMVSYFVP